MPIRKRWTRFTRANVEKLPSNRGIYELGDQYGNVIDIGGSDSRTGVRGRLITHLINKKYPNATYFRCLLAIDGLFSPSGIRMEAEESQKFQKKHGKKPEHTKRSPKPY